MALVRGTRREAAAELSKSDPAVAEPLLRASQWLLPACCCCCCCCLLMCLLLLMLCCLLLMLLVYCTRSRYYYMYEVIVINILYSYSCTLVPVPVYSTYPAVVSCCSCCTTIQLYDTSIRYRGTRTVVRGLIVGSYR
eukprot:COSAG01_NODE_5597_length_4156_cov_15.159724_4_plen_137_part_00